MHKIVDKYNAFELNEYRGIYELVAGNDNDGTFYKTWAIVSTYDSEVGHGVPAKKDSGLYRNIPVKVVLGDKAQAIEGLKFLLKQLEGVECDPGEPPVNDDKEVPF